MPIRRCILVFLIDIGGSNITQNLIASDVEESYTIV